MNRFPSLEDLRKSAIAALNPQLFAIGKVSSKASKYGNQKIELDGIIFDSLKESRRYTGLRQLQIVGEITDLQVHVPFQLSICRYIADFVYRNKKGKLVVEDVKSVATRTAAYLLKKKLMKKEKNITISEIL